MSVKLFCHNNGFNIICIYKMFPQNLCVVGCTFSLVSLFICSVRVLSYWTINVDPYQTTLSSTILSSFYGDIITLVNPPFMKLN